MSVRHSQRVRGPRKYIAWTRSSRYCRCSSSSFGMAFGGKAGEVRLGGRVRGRADMSYE